MSDNLADWMKRVGELESKLTERVAENRRLRAMLEGGWVFADRMPYPEDSFKMTDGLRRGMVVTDDGTTAHKVWQVNPSDVDAALQRREQEQRS